MAKKKKTISRSFTTHSTGKGAQYVALYYPMLESEAWKALTAYDQAVYIEMRKEYNPALEDPDQDFKFPINKKAKVIGMSGNTVARAIDNLIDKGFIRVKKRGQLIGIGGMSRREPHIYTYHCLWQQYGKNGYAINEDNKRMKES